MTTSYSTADVSPKDAGGAKFLAPINISTSQSDFALLAGIGASTIGATSRIHAGLQVGTHVAGSQINNNAPLIVLIGGAYTQNASTMAINNARPFRADEFGALFTTAPSNTNRFTAASTETYTTASGYLYSFTAGGCGVVAGGQVVLLNGATSITQLVFVGANETISVDWGQGGTCFASLKSEVRNTVGQVWSNAVYRLAPQP